MFKVKVHKIMKKSITMMNNIRIMNKITNKMIKNPIYNKLKKFQSLNHLIMII